jgi:hypothetical protein
MTSDNKPDQRIIDFIRDHHVLTLATSYDNQPWCANCFYAFHQDENAFVFTSDDDTRHIQEADANNYVAGSVVLETSVVGKIRGIQFQGFINRTKSKQHKSLYIKRFPYASLMKTNLWVVHLTYIKMTDNRLGFGKKLIWQKKY